MRSAKEKEIDERLEAMSRELRTTLRRVTELELKVMALQSGRVYGQDEDEAPPKEGRPAFRLVTT